MHFKPNMRKIQIAISLDLYIRLTWNLTGSCDQQQRLRGWSRMVVKQFQDGGRPPFWKSIYHHISVKNHPIFIKFCTQQQILNWMNITWSKMKKLHWTDSEFDRTYFLFENKTKRDALQMFGSGWDDVVVCCQLHAVVRPNFTIRREQYIWTVCHVAPRHTKAAVSCLATLAVQRATG